MMTETKFKQILTDAGMNFNSVHPDHFEEGKDENLSPPFLEYDYQQNGVNADGASLDLWADVTIRLFADQKGNTAEPELDAALSENDIRFNKSLPEYSPDDGLYQTTYTMEV